MALSEKNSSDFEDASLNETNQAHVLLADAPTKLLLLSATFSHHRIPHCN